MKATLTLIAFGLGFTALAQAQDLHRQVEFKINYAVTRGDASRYTNSLGETGTLARLDLNLYTTLFPTDEPPTTPYTSFYIVPGSWELTALDGSGFGLAANGVHSASVTNDYPSWDALSLFADVHSDSGAQTPGETILGGAVVLLTDPTRTALSSTALLPMPPFTAFSNGEVAVSWYVMPDEQFSFEGSQSIALGRVTSADDDPSRPAYRCQGFSRPARQQVTLGNGHRPLQLNAVLADSQGNATNTANLSHPPIVRVLNLGSFNYVASLATGDGVFSYRGGHWTYALRADALPGPGRYLVYMTTSDSNEYVFDQLCGVEVTVQ